MIWRWCQQIFKLSINNPFPKPFYMKLQADLHFPGGPSEEKKLEFSHNDQKHIFSVGKDYAFDQKLRIQGNSTTILDFKTNAFPLQGSLDPRTLVVQVINPLFTFEESSDVRIEEEFILGKMKSSIK